QGYEDSAHPEWGVYDGSGWLTVWATINCDPQAKLVDTEGRLLDRLWVEADDEIKVEIPTGQGYNDLLALFEWNFPCENKVWYKMYVCKDGELEPVPLPEWIDDNISSATPVVLPSLIDPTGTDPNIYIAVNLRLWSEDPQPVQNEYNIQNGESPELQGYRFGTSEFKYQPEEICHPLVTDDPYTGTLYADAQIGVDGIDGNPTVSQWGLIIMAVLLVSAGTIAIWRRRQAAA
ncbi:MAG: IPTL-CTERM sorting domain-containing protein, partial [Planctomycetota bacterium]